MNSILQRSLALIWLMACCSAAIAAHPFHISSAEMERNPQSQRFEVSLKLHALDLEQALSTQEKRKVNVEEDADVQQLLTSYLESHFFFTEMSHVGQGEDAKAAIEPKFARSKIHFVGQELKTNWLWLYFEIELIPSKEIDEIRKADEPQSAEALVLVNSVLLDVTDGQINTVAVRHDGKRVSLRTTTRQSWAEFPF